MKIVVLDIETTGLNPNTSKLLEVGIALYDTEQMKGLSYKEMLEKIQTARFVIKHRDQDLHGDYIAIKMHLDSGLLQYHVDITRNGKTPNKLDGVYKDVINQNTYIVEEDEFLEQFSSYLFRNGIEGTITVAGKNPMAFDIPYLEEYFSLTFSDHLRVRRRAVDPTIWYADWSKDRLPDLQQCKKEAKIRDQDFPMSDKVAHSSVEDALDIALLIHQNLK